MRRRSSPVDALDALGSAELRAALLFARGQPVPVTTDDVAAGLGIPRSAARSRLERLARAGLLAPAFERRSGRTGPGAGRPAKTYAVAAETAAIEFPGRHYEELVRRLIDAFPVQGRRERLGGVGLGYGRALGGKAQLRPCPERRAGLERACAALGSLGFQAALESLSGETAVIATPTCPLRPLVVVDPEARELDLGMWRGLVAAALGADPAGVACSTHDCLEPQSSCRVIVSLGG